FLYALAATEISTLSLHDALPILGEGAQMLRTKGEPGTGNIVEAVRHLRQVQAEIKQLQSMSPDEVMVFARDNQAPYDILMQVKEEGRLPVINYAAGG